MHHLLDVSYHAAVQDLVEGYVRAFPRAGVRNTPYYAKWIKSDVPPALLEPAGILPGWESACSKIGTSNLLLCLQTALLAVLEALVYETCRKANFRELVGLDTINPKQLDRVLTEFEDKIGLDPSVNRVFCWFRKPSVLRNDDPLWEKYQNLTRLVATASEGQTGSDYFADIYRTYFPLPLRKAMGEEFTSPSIVRFILDQAGYKPEETIFARTLLDPAAGFGAFLLEAVDRYLASLQLRPAGSVRKGLRPIQGCEYKAFTAFACHLLLTARFVEKGSRILGDNYMAELPQPIVRQGDALLPETFGDQKFDYVVGNPPYVRIHNIPKAVRKRYEQVFETALGRYDMAFLFVERGTKLLKDQGVLTYILTNKFMTSAAGKGLREFIGRNLQVQALIDLGDSEPFGAAVLPCILMLKRDLLRDGKPGLFPYATVRKAPDTASDQQRDELFPALSKALEHKHIQDAKATDLEALAFGQPVRCQLFGAQLPKNGATWHFASERQQRVLELLRHQANTTLGELSERITVGIKSTADDVFIRPMTQAFIEEIGLERELLFPYVEGKNVRRWQVDWNLQRDRYVLYPHTRKDQTVVPIGLRDYPRVKAYLERNRSRLARRDYVQEAGRAWYELWVHQDPAYFEKPFKILTPDFASRNTFAVDTNRYYFGGSALAIIPSDQDEMFVYYLLGLLNSKLYEFFHKVGTSTFIYAGRYRYWTSYLTRYPILDYRRKGKQGTLFDSNHLQEHHVDRCLHISETARRLSKGFEDQSDPEQVLNDAVYDLFSVEKMDREFIEESLKAFRRKAHRVS